MKSECENNPFGEDWISYINDILSVSERMKYVAVDLFAGCGGLSLGFEAVGIKTVGYEMVGDCCDTYFKNLGSKCHKVVIDKETGYPKMDILTGRPRDSRVFLTGLSFQGRRRASLRR